jgi:hypothetical protein
MKPFLFLVVLATYFIVDAQPIKGEAWVDVKKKGAGTLQVFYSDDPLINEKAKGQPEGLTLDVLSDFVEYVKVNHKVDLSLKLVYVNDMKSIWERMKISSGGVTCANFVLMTKERAKSFQFSPPLGFVYDVLITNSAKQVIKDVDDLKKTLSDAHGYGVSGSVQLERLQELKKNHLPNLQIDIGPSHPYDIENIAKDPKGVGFTSIIFYLEFVRKKLPIIHHPVLEGKPQATYFVFPLQSEWNNVFTEFIEANGGYNKSKRYSDLLIKYVGPAGRQLFRKEQ